MRFLRASDLTVLFAADGRVVLRSLLCGIELRGPAQVVPLLAWCGQPRSREQVVAAFGPPAGPAFDMLVEAEALVPEGQQDACPTFFASFALLDAHRAMLGDRPRMQAYAAAIRQLVQPGMVVLDAGTGSGVLACLAAQAGARRVYAVDDSDALDYAAAVVKASGLQERVELVRGNFAEVQLPERADLLVTETYGALALAEGGMGEVARACQRHLKLDGLCIPSQVELWLAPVDGEEPLQRAVGPFGTEYGPDLSPLRPTAMSRGMVGPIEPDQLAAPGQVFSRLDVAKPGACQGEARFQLPAAGRLTGWAAWFGLQLAPGLRLGTGPQDPPTHWPPVFLPMKPEELEADGPLQALVAISQAPDDRRGAEVIVQWRCGSRAGKGVWRVV